MELSRSTLDFINANMGADVRQLALGKHRADVDMTVALVQIAGRQAALHKLPSWAATPGLLYPVHLSMEQCTGEILASYKSGLVGKLFSGNYSMLDLTGGFGVDCVMLSCPAGRTCYNEMNPELCDIARHNFPLLGRPDIEVSNCAAQDFLAAATTDSFDLIYIDPARRDSSGRKLVSLHDCSPDVSELQDQLLRVSSRVMIKLSPMLDISRVMTELKSVSRVMAISIAGECKELLVLMERGFSGSTVIEAVNLSFDGKSDEVLSATMNEEQNAAPLLASSGDLQTGCYLYEPYSAYMKSGLYRTMSAKYGVSQLAADSHLYVSSQIISAFPGRMFRIDRIQKFDKRSAKAFFQDIPQANIAVRNFPLTADELRQRFKVKDGGTHFVFASVWNGQKLLFDTRRV